jgi:Winged helix-turn helix
MVAPRWAAHQKEVRLVARSKRPRYCTEITAKGTRCTRRAKLDGKCRQHSELAGGGRQPDAIETKAAARLADFLGDGVTLETACAACGIARRTVYNWLERAQEVGAPAEYVEFAELIELARASGEARNVRLIADAAEKDWKAAAWLLERNAPERYAKPSVRPPAQRKLPADEGEQDGAADDLPDNVVTIPSRKPVADASW